MKIRNSDRHCAAYFQYKCGNKFGDRWGLIDIEVRDVFSNITSSMLKYAAGLNYCK